jgi:GTP pyrophosphokinase
LSEKALGGALKKLKYETVDELLVGVGSGNVAGREVIHAVFPGVKSADGTIPTPPKRPRSRKPEAKDGMAIPITGLIPGMAINFAGCCHPLPGDRIVGIVATGKGVTIHTIDCETLESFADAPERWLDVAWHMDPAKAEAHVGRLHAGRRQAGPGAWAACRR